MSSLAATQRQLRDLIKRRPLTEAPDGYVASVAGSPELQLIHEIDRWWRCLGLRRACPLICRLLVQRDQWDRCVSSFIRDCHVPGQVDAAAPLFLEHVATVAFDELVIAVARFERAYLAAGRGERRPVTVAWPQEPYGVLRCLLRSEPVPSPDGERWTTRVSAEVEGFFSVAPVA
jgi:hypothetical protein